MDKEAWITGIRKDQTNTRGNISFVQIDDMGLYKICPLADWTQKDIFRYIDVHKLPTHPLFAQGYMSIGCEPCTRPIFKDEDERAGRWAGQDKTECGIHISTNEEITNEN